VRLSARIASLKMSIEKEFGFSSPLPLRRKKKPGGFAPFFPLPILRACTLAIRICTFAFEILPIKRSLWRQK